MNAFARIAAALTCALCTFGATPRDARVRAHPYYVILVQIDREIAALKATERVPGLAHAASEIRHDRARASSDAADAAAQLGAMAGFEARDYAWIDAGPAAAGRVRTAQHAVLAHYDAALDARAARAYADRQQTLLEMESTYAYDLEKRDAAGQAPLRAKLAVVRDPDERRALAARLNAIAGEENARVAAMRSRDDAELASYRAELAAGDASAAAREANSQARIAAGANGDDSATMQAWKGFDGTWLAAPVDALAFEHARDEIDARSAARARDLDASLHDTNAEIAALQRERRALYDEIVRLRAAPSS